MRQNIKKSITFLTILILLVLSTGEVCPETDWSFKTGVTNFDSKNCANDVEDLGLDLVGVIVYWGDIEPVKGEFKITSAVISAFEDCVPEGAEPLLTIKVNSPWGVKKEWKHDKEYIPHKVVYPPKDYNDFENFIEVLADSLKGICRYFQIGNEWNNYLHLKYNQQRWAGTMDEAIEVVKVTSEALKRKIPEAYLVMGAFTGSYNIKNKRPPRSEFIEDLIEGVSKYVDAYAFHHYGDDSELEAKLKWYQEKGSKPVWITEIGNPAFNRIGDVSVEEDHFFLNIGTNKDLLTPQQIEDSVFNTIRREVPDFLYLPENRSILENGKAEQIFRIYTVAHANGAQAAIWFYLYTNKKPHYYFRKPKSTNAYQAAKRARNRNINTSLIDKELELVLPAYYNLKIYDEMIRDCRFVSEIGSDSQKVYKFQESSGKYKYVCWSTDGPQMLKPKLPDGKYLVTTCITEIGPSTPDKKEYQTISGVLNILIDSTPRIIERIMN
ncbi:MAG: hypothetical protein GY855_06320 [candidate division Zixibacteria bacterium]|nr:hypothetical protein [candidate division Zixibacteria bacterium]